MFQARNEIDRGQHMAATKCQLRHGGRLFKGMTINEEKVWEAGGNKGAVLKYRCSSQGRERAVEKRKVVGRAQGET